MRRTLTWILAAAVLCLPFGLLHSSPVSAAYTGDSLISDRVFTDTSTMSRNAIQSFLEKQSGTLKSRKNISEGFYFNCKDQPANVTQRFKDLGAPCDKAALASDIIYYVGKAYGINPQVIIATLQKEQGLITAQNPPNYAFASAMGYGCPTTGTCSGYTGFFNQVDWGTWQFRNNLEGALKNPPWWNGSSTLPCSGSTRFYKPSLYPYQNVSFYDEDDVLYRTYYIKSAATSALYCYTPHAYNNPQGLYDLPKFGTKGRYYSGSYNFVYYFELWFGSTSGYQPLLAPRYMILKQDTPKTNLITMEQNGTVGVKGQAIYLTSKTVINGVTYVRTEYDTFNRNDFAFRVDALREMPSYQPLYASRQMVLKQNAQKTNLRTLENSGDTGTAGQVIYFTSKTTIGGITYVRSEYDTVNDNDFAFSVNELNELPKYESLQTPRKMIVKQSTQKTNLLTLQKSGDLGTTGQVIYFTSKTTIGGVTYVRTEYDTVNHNDFAFRVDELDELPS